MGGHRRRWGYVLVLGLVTGLHGCGLARSAAPPAPGTYAAAIGRVELIRDGKVVGQGKDFKGDAMTRISFVSRATHEAYSVAVEDPSGTFMVRLPPGTYDVGMGYYIWIYDTPFEIEVPAVRELVYVGLLRVRLFARGSFLGGWARASGGAIPITDNDYAVADESRLLSPPGEGGPPLRILLARMTPPAP